jgi:hypothetical protein
MGWVWYFLISIVLFAARVIPIAYAAFGVIVSRSVHCVVFHYHSDLARYAYVTPCCVDVV